MLIIIESTLSLYYQIFLFAYLHHTKRLKYEQQTKIRQCII